MKSNSIALLRNLALASFLLLTVVACKKDDEEKECVPPALEKQLVGTWETGLTAMGVTIPVTLTFTEDGEVQGGNLSELLKNVNGIGDIDDLIKYDVKSDTSVDIIVTEDGEVKPFPLSVSERECKKVVLKSAVGDVTITLSKQ